MSFPIYDTFEYFFGCKRFALWHRYQMPDSYRAVDIDIVGTERGRVSYIIESSRAKPSGKSCNVTRSIAKAMEAHAFVVQIPAVPYEPPVGLPWGQVRDFIMSTPAPETIVVRQVYPPPEWQKELSWTDFTELLGSCRSITSLKAAS